MTIRRYLFLLITGVLLLVALIQVALLLKFKQQVAEEVSMRGRLIADKVLEIAVEEFQLPESQAKVKRREVLITPHASPKIVMLELSNKSAGRVESTVMQLKPEQIEQPEKVLAKLTQLPPEMRDDIKQAISNFQRHGDKAVQIEKPLHKVSVYRPGNRLQQFNQVEIKQQLKSTIDRIYRTTSDEKVTVDFAHKVIAKPVDGSAIFVSTSNRDLNAKLHGEASPSLNLMVKYMLFSILITTLFALCLAFWLSRKFSAPLQNLITGFKQLEQGNFGTKVESAGVNEVQQTIQRFNTMSEQLDRLAAAEEKLKQQAHLQEIGDVSKGIAHALRNPMHTIGLAVEQLSDPMLPETSRDKLMAKIQNKLQQLDKSISALLTITTGEIDRTETIAVNELVQDVVMELKQSHDPALAPLNIHLEVDKDHKIIGARSELRAVLHTLIFNGYEASLEQELLEDIQLNIALHTENDQTSISVQDNGPGLPNEIAKQLFQPHVSSKAEGAGMGLYIAKRLTQLYYNGDVQLENSDNGCIATLSISSPQANTKNQSNKN